MKKRAANEDAGDGCIRCIRKTFRLLCFPCYFFMRERRRRARWGGEPPALMVLRREPSVEMRAPGVELIPNPLQRSHSANDIVVTLSAPTCTLPSGETIRKGMNVRLASGDEAGVQSIVDERFVRIRNKATGGESMVMAKELTFVNDGRPPAVKKSLSMKFFSLQAAVKRGAVNKPVLVPVAKPVKESDWAAAQRDAYREHWAQQRGTTAADVLDR